MPVFKDLSGLKFRRLEVQWWAGRTNRMIVRNSTGAEELPALYEIEKECFVGSFRWSRDLFGKTLLSAAQKNNVWIAEEDGKIVGFLLADETGSKGHIETVNIPKAARRRGIASELIAVCEKEFKKRGRIEIALEVHTENPAQILYHKLGYRVTGFRRHYYKLHCHALTMAKKLDDTRLCVHPTCKLCSTTVPA